MSVSSDGKLTPRMERYTANTPEKPHRVPTMGVLSPDENFFIVGTTFDLPIAISGTYPDGSPIFGCLVQTAIYVRRFECARSRRHRYIRVDANGTLSDPSFQDGGAVLLSTSLSYTTDRIPSSSDTPSVTESACAALTKMAELASARS